MNNFTKYLILFIIIIVMVIGCSIDPIAPFDWGDGNDYLCVKHPDSTAFDKLLKIDNGNHDDLLNVINFVVTPDEENFLINSGINGIWRVGINNEDQELISGGLWVSDNHLSLSNDGGIVVFSSRGDIYTVNIEGSNLTQITDTPDDYEDYPGFAGLTDDILFTCIYNLNEQNQYHTISRMQFDGSGRENLVIENSRAPVRFSYPAVLGTSGKIVYLVKGDSPGVELLNLGDGSLDRVFSEEMHDDRISISANGEVFAFSGSHGYAVSNDQGDIILEHFNSYDFQSLSLSPDGTRIVYTKNHDIKVKTISSGAETPYCDGEQPYWQGEEIYYLLDGTHWL